LRKTNYTKYNPKTYKVYGSDPVGNHTLQIVMSNDRGCYDFVRKNAKRLSRMSKGRAITLIKSNATESWAKRDLKTVNGSNTNANQLKLYLNNFNK